MENELTVKSEVQGMLVWSDQKFFGIGITAVADADGKPLPNLYAWRAISTTPINIDMLHDQEVEPVYDVPVILMDCPFVSRQPGMPTFIEHLNSVAWDDVETDETIEPEEE